MTLTATYEKTVPFHDLDPVGILWHGNYVAYMEEAREFFLQKYGLGYLQMLHQGYIEPVTHVDIDYKGSFQYGDTAVIEVRYVPSKRSRIDLEYRFFRKSDGRLMTQATSSQHFIVADTKEVAFSRPDFYKQWQDKWKVFEQ